MARRSWLYESVQAGLTDNGPWSKDAIDTMLTRVADLPRLTGEELTAAEDLGIARLREGDTRAAIALGAAGCHRAVAALLAVATSPVATASNRLRAAEGLLLLGNATGPAVALEIARGDGWIGDRREAVRVLGGHGADSTIAALVELTTDADAGLRYEAGVALVRARTRTAG